jgi:hypothetical protein
MLSTEIDPRVGRVNASRRQQDDALIARAGKRTEFAGTALASAAVDLDSARSGRHGKALTGIAELVREEGERVSRLAKDIESRRVLPTG